MPPSDKSPESQVRYFLRLLAALASMGGGEVHIPLSEIRKIEAEGSRQALIEDTDCENDTLVLRFGTKHSAMYPVEPECLTKPTPPQPVQPSASPAPPARRPLTDQDLARAEQRIRQVRQAARVRQERPQNDQEIESLLRGGV